MQVFKSYFKILEKYKVSIIMYGAIFLAITLFMALNDSGKVELEFTNNRISMHVVNKDEPSELVDSFLEYMETYAEFIEVEDKEEARKDALFYGNISYILTIPEGFTEAFLAGNDVVVQKQSMPGYAGAIAADHAIDNYFNKVRSYIKFMPDQSFEVINQAVTDNLKLETTVEIKSDTSAMFNNSNEFNKIYFNILGYVLIGSYIVGVSMVMSSFREINIRRRHSAAPLSSKSMNFQLLLGNLIFTLCYLFVFILSGYLSNKYRRFDANTILFWVNGITFSLSSLSLSYLIGIIIKSKKAVGAISSALSLGLAFISGMFVPQEFMGDNVLRVASFTPSFWYVRTNNTIGGLASIGLSDLLGILGMMGIQLGFGAALVSIALVISKRQSQQAN